VWHGAALHDRPRIETCELAGTLDGHRRGAQGAVVAGGTLGRGRSVARSGTLGDARGRSGTLGDARDGSGTLGVGGDGGVGGVAQDWGAWVCNGL
jgi:hypothetical protein